MQLARKRRSAMTISMTPLVDVMLILLIFFMVTSSYLDLDMIPLVSGAKPGTELATAPGSAATRDDVAKSGSLLVRLGADGRTFVSGQAVDPVALKAMVVTRLASRPETPLLILPSSSASTQALVSLMDLLGEAGARDLKVIRLEAPK